MTGRVLAIDPGTHAGWAVWDDGRLGDSGTLNGTDVVSCAKLLDSRSPDWLVVEDWHIRETGRRKRTGIKTTARNSILWGVLSEERGIMTMYASTMAWQAWAGVTPGDKRAIRAVAHQLADRPVAADEADAILIGGYASERIANVKE